MKYQLKTAVSPEELAPKMDQFPKKAHHKPGRKFIETIIKETVVAQLTEEFLLEYGN